MKQRALVLRCSLRQLTPTPSADSIEPNKTQQQLQREQRKYRLLWFVSLTIIAFILSRYFSNRFPVYEQDTDVTTVDIALSEQDAEGQFERLADELNLSDSQQKAARKRIMAVVEERTADANIDPENKETMANIMASTIRQEFDQLAMI